MVSQLPHLQWLIEDPQQVTQRWGKTTQGWKWNYGPDLKNKGWSGVWENFSRLYTYWACLLPRHMGGLRDARQVLSIPDARQFYQNTVVQHGEYMQKRRANVSFMPAFIQWLQTVGKPMDAEFLAWYPDKMLDNPDSWRSSYGNPRKLPASSMYVVNASRMFSNQHQPDGPFIMSIHSRGYKNAQLNFLAAPYMRANKQVLTEYSKYKYPPMAWKSVLPYASTQPTKSASQGAFMAHINFLFTSGSPKLTHRAWNKQIIRNILITKNVYTTWNQIKIDPSAPPVYLSIEPQDLGTSGSIYRGTLIPSINYCNSLQLPLKYK